jgi:hypothetical protein
MATDTLYTTAEVAEDLGISMARLRLIAARYGIGKKVGRDWLFTDADLEQLRQRPDHRRKEARA